MTVTDDDGRGGGRQSFEQKNRSLGRAGEDNIIRCIAVGPLNIVVVVGPWLDLEYIVSKIVLNPASNNRTKISLASCSFFRRIIFLSLPIGSS